MRPFSRGLRLRWAGCGVRQGKRFYGEEEMGKGHAIPEARSVYGVHKFGQMQIRELIPRVCKGREAICPFGKRLRLAAFGADASAVQNA